jgi:hypothetical protein
MTGLLTADAKAHSKTLGNVAGFWGISDGDNDTCKLFAGTRRGARGVEATPAAARMAPGERVFVSGDRVGLLVDMDFRTLTILRNGEPIPSLVFDNLPSGELYVGVVPFSYEGGVTTVRLVD